MPSDDDRQAMTIRLTRPRHDWLRTAAFNRRIPMQQIIDEALDQYIANPTTRTYQDQP